MGDGWTADDCFQVHCSYGAFWLAFAMFLIPSLGIKQAYAGDERAYSMHLGIFLILWCILTIVFLIAALRTSMVVIGVLFFLVLAFFFLAIAEFISTTHPTASVRVNKVGGVMSVICAFLALWAGAAGLMIDETTMVRLPLGVMKRPQRTHAAA
jgi:succinate-acetate transporter protein